MKSLHFTRDTSQKHHAEEIKKFGLILGIAITVISLWPALLRGETPHWWGIVLGIAFGGWAHFAPSHLTPLYRIWMKIGSILGWINTRIILGLGFYGIFTPIGLFLRLRGKDPMRRKFNPKTATYREERSGKPGTHMEKPY